MLISWNFIAGKWRHGADWADSDGSLPRAYPADAHIADDVACKAQAPRAAAGLEARAAAVLASVGRELITRSRETSCIHAGPAE